MDKDCIAAVVFVTILLSVFTCFLGMILGFNTADGHWESLIADAGIRLVRHTVMVDGAVTTNWVEVVHLGR